MNELELLCAHFELDPTIPSGLRWSTSASRSIAPGQPAGSRDTRGYYKVRLRGRQYGCHRVILLLNGIFPSEACTQVDHIDRNRSNNLVSNLRWVTPSVNIQNCRVTGEVPYRYVRRKRTGRFEAQYKFPQTKQKVYVGVYDSALTAHLEAVAHRLEHYWVV